MRCCHFDPQQCGEVLPMGCMQVELAAAKMIGDDPIEMKLLSASAALLITTCSLSSARQRAREGYEGYTKTHARPSFPLKVTVYLAPRTPPGLFSARLDRSLLTPLLDRSLFSALLVQHSAKATCTPPALPPHPQPLSHSHPRPRSCSHSPSRSASQPSQAQATSTTKRAQQHVTPPTRTAARM